MKTKNDHKIEIGAKILVNEGFISFGTRLGVVDRWLGEKDQRRMVIRLENGEDQNLDLQKSTHQNLCNQAYEKLESKYNDETKFNQKLQETEDVFQQKLQKANKTDQINWAEIFINYLRASTILLPSLPPIRAADNNVNNSVQDLVLETMTLSNLSQNYFSTKEQELPEINPKITIQHLSEQNLKANIEQNIEENWSNFI